MASTYELIIKATDQTSGPLGRMNQSIRKTEKSASGLSSALKVAGAALVGFATGSAARGIIAQYTAFEKYRTVLRTFLGSSAKANSELKRLQKLADDLPQDLADVTNAFTIFSRFGLDTSSKSLTAFSNIATANAKSFSQLGEAVADALTGEFERLKEFGIKVSKENGNFVARIGEDQVALSKSSKGLVQQLKALGEEGGRFGGAAEANAGTLGQAFSNLAGAINLASIAFGEGAAPGLKTLTTTIRDLLTLNREAIARFGELAGIFAVNLAKGINFVVANADKFKIAIMALIALKVGNWATLATVAILRFSKSMAVSGAAAIKLGKALRANLIGLILSGAIVVGEMTGAIDKLFGAIDEGSKSDGFNDIATSIENALNELSKFTGDTPGTGGRVIKGLEAEVKVLEKLQTARKEQLLNAKLNYKQAIAQGKVDTEALAQMNQLTSEVERGQAVLEQFAKARELASQPLRLTISASYTDQEKALIALVEANKKARLEELEKIKVLGTARKALAENKTLGLETAHIQEVINQLTQKEVDATNNLISSQSSLLSYKDQMIAKATELGKQIFMMELALDSASNSTDEQRKQMELLLPKLKEAQSGYLELANNSEYFNNTMKQAKANIQRNRDMLDTFNKLKTAKEANNIADAVYLENLRILASSGLPEAQKELEKMVTLADTIKDVFTKSMSSVGNEIARAVAQGKLSLNSFKDYINKILEDILAAIIQKQFINPLVSSSTSWLTSFAGKLFGGPTSPGVPPGVSGLPARAAGGPVASGVNYLVGEKGPEMFMPTRSGSIVPNDQLNMSGGGETVVNFNINAIDTQTGTQFLIENKNKIIGMITQAQNQRGRQGILT